MEYQKPAEATGDVIGNKVTNKKLWKPQEVHQRIVQKQLRIKMIKKYVKKDIYLQK